MTTIPDIQLTPREISDREARHQAARAQYRERGFDSVAESQAFADSLAAVANGEMVDPAFLAARVADEKLRAEFVARIAANGAAWRAEQRRAAAAEARDRAAERLSKARATLGIIPQLKGETFLDFGRGVTEGEFYAYGMRLAAHHFAEKDLREVQLPAMQRELEAAEVALDAASKPAAAPAARGRN